MVQVEQVLNEEYENCAKDNLSLSAVSLIPFLSGERSIGYRDGANFCVAGMTRNSTSAHFMKACLEGVILRLEAILRLLRQGLAAGKRQPRIVASGSALEKNALWRQMLADCTGQQVQMDTCTRESTSTGVATMVAVALAMERDMATESTPYLTRDDHTGQPVYSSPRLPITESYWAVALEDQENLIDAVSSLW
jgi:gluconokinase